MPRNTTNSAPVAEITQLLFPGYSTGSPTYDYVTIISRPGALELGFTPTITCTLVLPVSGPTSVAERKYSQYCTTTTTVGPIVGRARYYHGAAWRTGRARVTAVLLLRHSTEGESHKAFGERVKRTELASNSRAFFHGEPEHFSSTARPETCY